MKKEVMNLAWSLKKANQFLTFSYCLKTAWSIIKLQKALRAGVVAFSFQKVDGEVRRAVGTLDTARINYTRKTENEREGSICQIKYFDIEKQSFRSFRAERFLGMAA